METLKTLHTKIEKKTSSINKVKDYLNTNPNSCISSEMRESLKRYETDRENLQSEFDKLYNKNN